MLKGWSRIHIIYVTVSFSSPSDLTPFPKAFIIKGNVNNGRNSHSGPFSSLVTSFPDTALINEEAPGHINEEDMSAINEAVIGAIIAPRNPLS